MSLFGGSSDGGQQQQLRRQQTQTQAGINEIQSIFDGGTYGSDPVNLSKWSPQQFVKAGTSDGNSMAAGTIGMGFGDPVGATAGALFGGGSQDSWIPVANGVKLPAGAETHNHNVPLALGQTYYMSDGSPVVASMKNYQMLLNKAAAGGLFTGSKTSTGFDKSFYDKAATDYTNYANPILNKQFQTTKNNLTYSLARAGLSTSGAAVQRNSSLNNEFATNQDMIANNAIDRSNQLRTAVNNQKNQLIGEVEAGANPSVVAGQAAGAVSQLRAPSPIQPLGSLFQDWSSQYLNNQTSQSNNNNIWPMLGNGAAGAANPPASSSYFVQG